MQERGRPAREVRHGVVGVEAVQEGVRLLMKLSLVARAHRVEVQQVEADPSFLVLRWLHRRPSGPHARNF